MSLDEVMGTELPDGIKALMRGWWDQGLVYKPGIGSSRSTKFVGNLILNLSAFRTVRKKSLSLKPPNLY